MGWPVLLLLNKHRLSAIQKLWLQSLQFASMFLPDVPRDLCLYDSLKRNWVWERDSISKILAIRFQILEFEVFFRNHLLSNAHRLHFPQYVLDESVPNQGNKKCCFLHFQWDRLIVLVCDMVSEIVFHFI